MGIFQKIFGKRVSKMSFDEAVMDMELRWRESTDGLILIDFMESVVGDYKDKMKKSDYETLRDSVLFDWEENTVCEFV
jgi:hypothetical protein